MNRKVKHSLCAVLGLTAFFCLAVCLTGNTAGRFGKGGSLAGSPLRVYAASGDAISVSGISNPNQKVEGITSVYVLYETEEIEVKVDTSSRKVFYAPLKSNLVTGVKPAELIPAAPSATGMFNYIDISTISAAKDSFVGVTTTTEAGEDGLVPVHVVKIAAYEKKFNVNIDWSYEGQPNSFSGLKVLRSVEIVAQSGDAITYYQPGEGTPKDGRIENGFLQLQWRKGINGKWKDFEKDMSYTDWTSMKEAGALIYIRIDAKNQTPADPGRRYSKELKVKIPVTKAPSAKVDVNKLDTNLKNGMQFRLHGSTTGKWYTILPYNSKSTVKAAVREVNLATLFNPYKEDTAEKMNSISIRALTSVLYRDTPMPVSLASIDVDIRVAATVKKPASRVGMLSIPIQGTAPTVTEFKKINDTTYKVGDIKATDSSVASPLFEYALVRKADYDANLVNFSTVKWSPIKPGTEIKNTAKGDYYRNGDASRISVPITESGMAILIRRKGVNGSAKAKAVLASNCCAIVVPTQIDATPAATPTPTPSPAATPTPAP